MRNKKKQWSGFFTSLLGVIMGIILTFGVNSLWQKREDKKKIKELLILVRNELETNKKWFKSQEKYLKQDHHAFNKLLEADGNMSTVSVDSLQIYLDLISYYQLRLLTTSAWEIFQSSEMIQKISNKELIIWLTNCYFEINTFYDLIMKNYWDKKWQLIEQIIYISSTDFDELFEFINAVMSNRESFVFLQTFIEFVSQSIFFEMDAIIDYTILLLDEYGNFRYENDIMNEKYDSFIKARRDSVHHKNDTIGNNKKNK